MNAIEDTMCHYNKKLQNKVFKKMEEPAIQNWDCITGVTITTRQNFTKFGSQCKEMAAKSAS